MNSPLVVVVVDALRSGLLVGVPGSVVGGIVPPFAFEPDSAYLCGRFPEESDNGTHFWFFPENSPFNWLRNWGTWPDRMPMFMQMIIRRMIRVALRHKSATPRLKRSLSTARIPFRLLPYFDVVQQFDPFDNRFSEHPSVFDLLRERGDRWLYLGAPITNSTIQEVWKGLHQYWSDNLSLVFLFVSTLDEIGHQFSPDSDEYARGVQDVSSFVEQVQHFVEHRANSAIRMLIFGDHGMVPVRHLVPIWERLQHLRARLCSDYVCFLDSTLARFWFFNERAQREITDMILEIEGGQVVTPIEQEKYRIRYKHNRFGDLIWWAEGGNLIFPNFYQYIKPVKGMHGYRQEVIDNQTEFHLIDPELSVSFQLKEPVEMVDMFATMVRMLKLKSPDGSSGEPIHHIIKRSRT